MQHYWSCVSRKVTLKDLYSQTFSLMTMWMMGLKEGNYSKRSQVEAIALPQERN